MVAVDTRNHQFNNNNRMLRWTFKTKNKQFSISIDLFGIIIYFYDFFSLFFTNLCGECREPLFKWHKNRGIYLFLIYCFCWVFHVVRSANRSSPSIWCLQSNDCKVLNCEMRYLVIVWSERYRNRGRQRNREREH